MLRHIVAFEIRYWLRSWMLWIFFFVIGALFFGACSSDNITVGGALSNTYRNAPFVIETYYSIVGFFTLLMATAFVNSAAARDFSLNTYQIIFSTPLSRFDFLMGRFLGATLVSIIPMLGVSAGVLLAKYMPWVDPDRMGPVVWAAHLQGILTFAIPNTFIFAAILFTIAVLARNEIVSFVAALVLLAGYGVSAALLQNVEREKIGALLDPFGVRTFAVATKYWTVAEKNQLAIGYSGLLLWNRLLWLGVGVLFLLFAYSRFSFAERRKKSARPKAEVEREAVVAAPIQFLRVTFQEAGWKKFLGSTRIHFLGIVKSTPFIVILVAGLLNCVPSIALNATQNFGVSTLPVTYSILEIISGTLYIFIVAMITYYAGVLVWKDRDTRMDEISDSLPTPEWVAFASRLTALAGMVMIVQALALTSGVIVQAAYGYHRFQLDLYAKELFLRDGSFFLFLGVLAFFFHVHAPNKYVGYFVYIAFLIANVFIWRPLNVATNLVQFANRPNVIYSDFYGDAPFRAAWDWFTIYWLFFCGLLAVATIVLWPRGKESSWRERWRNGRIRFHGALRILALVSFLGFAATGAWIAYNTMVLNPLLGPKDIERRQSEYEKTYRQFAKIPMPRVRDVNYAIDLFPAKRGMVMNVDETIVNPFAQPIEQIHFSLDRQYETDIQIPGAKLTKDDTRLYYRIYQFSPPLQPNESRVIHFTVKSEARGFENEVSNTTLVQNGTFFNNQVAPIIGYDPGRELTDPNDRKKYGLGEQVLMPLLERNCTADCMDTYLGGHSDWADVDTVISTSTDQMAVAPGSLLRQWQENGRNYYEYKLDHPSMNFYSFISARYVVAREEWNGIKVEVYYLKEHPWNVPRMLNSIKKSLAYYTENYGPYYHKEARIIEFPRVAQFAQAFPGTMPYSESIGFIANLEHPDDIDMVFYVVAHEMGHQWWAHQVIGANMQGATFLSESLAQYSALMVMQKEYGRDIMRKFLRYEMDRYLASRGRERLKERPLLTVEANQGYIHYEKASVVLFYLKEMIGEDKVDSALHQLVLRYAYAPPPYPTSWALVDGLSSVTPAEDQYLMKDLFEDITIFSNRTLDATAHKRPDGKYDVTIQIETRKFKADPKGNETEVPVDDWIDIGAFAKPEKKKKYGKTLYRDRVHITQTKSTYTFATDELPDQAGVDPFLLLIDRIPDDNTKKVTLGSPETSATK
jgi:ABC-2 type transport system permease protein